MGMFTAELDTTELAVQNIMPSAGTIKNFFVFVQAAPGAGGSWVITVRKQTPPAASAATAVTCTIAGTAVSCSDLTHTASFAAGDLIAIQVTPVGAPVASPGQWTAVFGP